MPAIRSTRSRAVRCRAGSRCGSLRTIAANVRGTLQSLRFCAAQRPDLVIATGGYVCFPVALAARIRAARASLSRADRPARAQRGAGFDEPAARADRRRGLGVPTRFAAKYERPGSDPCTLRGCRRARRRSRGLGSIRRARRSWRWAAARARARSTMRWLRLTGRGGLPDGWQLLHLTGESDYERVTATLARRRTRASSCAPISTTWPTPTRSPICC